MFMLPMPFKDLTFIDLSHTLSPSIPSWDGRCGFQHDLRGDYDPHASYQVRTNDIRMQAGMGTHIDAPAHFIPGGRCINDLDLRELIAPCIVINVSNLMHEQYFLSVQDIGEFEKQNGKIPPGCFVIVYTGWETYWATPKKYRNNLVFPSVSIDAAQVLLKRDIVGLGIDTLSPDRPEDGFLVHKLILGADKYIVENIANASKLPPIGAYTLACPLKIESGTESPMRFVGISRN
ncbi:MAG TPA: cyclase family protein [Alphaproteobacteria bacterium]|nr:cyclase family protein [Alphaproteobacteria bacterium]